jgi:hypothetical protein
MSHNQHTEVKKYDHLREEIEQELRDGGSLRGVADKIIKKHNLPANKESFRKHIRKVQRSMSHPALAQQCETVGVPIEDVKHYWHKGKHFSLFVKGKQTPYDEIRESIIQDITEHAPKYKRIVYKPDTDSYLLVIDPADIHLNKLCSAFETGDESNHNVIYRRVVDGVTGIIQKAQGYKIDQILFVAGNDILHVDSPKNTTTSGTPQDVSMMWYDAFTLARKLMVECIEMLLPIAPVHFQYNPSNHDYVHGFFLAQTLQAWFNRCEQVTFDVSIAHRKYFTYGLNLIGTTHGDGAREGDLALLMAHEASDSWAVCKHRYYYTHHIHHKKSKDYMSVCVESLRSPSGTDSWHHRNGYQHAPKAIEAFVHSKVHGQVARITHLF